MKSQAPRAASERAQRTAAGRATNVNWLASPLRRTLLATSLLLVLTVVLYLPVNGHAFVNYDDDIYVRFNPHVTSGMSWSTFRWAFTSFDASNWHPLTWLSHALDCQLFDLNPGGHHDTNLLLHTLNVLLLFWVLRRATGCIGRSLVVAALFAVHPVNVESVAWIAERKNLLSLLFFLLALGSYRWYASRPAVGRYVVVAVLFALGLMSKPQIITLPFVLMLWDYWPLRRIYAGPDHPLSDESEDLPPRAFSWLLLEKVPLLALSAISAAITVEAQRAAGAMSGVQWHPFSMREQNAVVAYVEYLREFLWPVRLAPLYPYPENSLAVWRVLAAALLLLAITGVAIVYRRHRYLPVGWFWFLGTMVPMVGLIQVGVQARADRYAYLPFIGLFFALVWSIADWAAQHHIAARVVPAASIAAVLALAIVTHQQLGYWKDSVTLWSHTLQVTSRNWVAENNLAHGYLDLDDEERAIPHFRSALAINPAHADSNLSLGAYEQGHGDLPGAIQQYQKVISLTRNEAVLEAPSREKAFRNMGIAYRDISDYAHARDSFGQAVALNPRDVSAWMELGTIAMKTGDAKTAVQAYSRVVAIEPTDVAYLLLAKATQASGDEKSAQKATQRAQAMSLNFAQTKQTAQRMLQK